MTHYLRLFLCLVLLTVASTAYPQSAIRPYNQWEATQFVAISVRQPSDYVRADNNWDIVYTLRTPHTLKQLRDKGIPFTNSQIYLLELSGLIYADEGRWQTIIPILDKAQTDSLRSFSRVVADAIYDKTKTDFAGLTATITSATFSPCRSKL